MRLTSVSLVAGFALSQCVSAYPNIRGLNPLKPRRASSLLISPAAQPQLPSAQQASTNAATVGLNLTDIQNDILVGMKKNKELFFFFGITDAAAFKSKLGTDILSLITSTEQVLSVSTQPITAVNVAFSQTGLLALGITDDLGDAGFAAGQFLDAGNLGDPGTGNWISGFAGTSVHGVFLLASDTLDNVNAELANIQSILNGSITEFHRLQGEARPGDQQGHEHFGFMDGISQPAVDGFSTALPGQQVVSAGVILVGQANDPVTARPAWAQSGSFLAFRQMEQRVPEFNKFLTDNALSMPNLTEQQNVDLLGARMMGRWKSGAPVDLTPLVDDPVLGADSQRNNDFNFTHAGFTETTDETHCPFAAHVRKVNPRSDFNPENTQNHIIRSSIPYGPEVTDAEATSNTTNTERGLAFVAYQSSLGNGFQFLQKNWVDNANFFFGKTSNPGVDPIIGSTNAGLAPGNAPRPVSGLDPQDPTRIITLDIDFIVSRGGEYFFSPSLSAIQNTLSV